MQTTNRLHTHAFVTSSILYRAALTSALMVATIGTDAFALPRGAQVESGDIVITQPTGHDLVINQGTDKAIINWQNFDILNGESTRFIQPNSNSIALNRIGGGSPSQILGTLSANGRLVLINPNGVIFGAGSRVDVAGLVASTADIKSNDFLAGNLHFSKPGNADASIINKGTITAADGGLVALVAPGVRNDGVIQAKYGTVHLASTETMAIDLYGDNLYSFAVGAKTVTTPKDEDGRPMASAVENNGSITAGTVLLTANAARDIVTNAVNNKGIIEASNAHREGGTIVLDGGVGRVHTSGKLAANGTKGGKITVTGKQIELANATIDASGANAGGQVRIGGDYQGGGTVAHADTVSVDADSVINVSATEKGNGGLAVIWSDLATVFVGKILGTAGIHGGDGGVAEVSSKDTLDFRGRADMHGVHGAKGSLLLDPTDIIIGAAQAAGINLTLDSGTDVTVQTSDAGADAGNITLNSDIFSTGTGSLTMLAHNNITLNNAINLLLGNVTLTANKLGTGANGAIALNNVSIGTLGRVVLNAKDVLLNGASQINSAGNILINNTGRFFSNTAASLNSSLGSVSVAQNTAGSIQNAIDAVGTHGTTANVTLGAGTYDQIFQIINRANFNLSGQGASTIIKPSSLTGATVVSSGTPWQSYYRSIGLVKDSSNTNVSNMTFDSGLLSYSAHQSGLAYINAGGAVNDVTIDGANRSYLGLFVVADSTQGQSARTVTATDVVSQGNNWSGAGVIGDNLTMNFVGGTYNGTNGEMGIELANGSHGSLTGTNVIASSKAGIVIRGGHDYTLTDTVITGSGTGTGIRDDGSFYGVQAASNMVVRNATVSNTLNGISANNGSNWTVIGGNYTGTGSGNGTGIAFNNLTGTNTVTGMDGLSYVTLTAANYNEGVAVTNTANANVIAATINNTTNAVHLINSDNATVYSNDITGAYKGIVLENSNSALVSGNAAKNITGLGIDLLGSSNSFAIDNYIQGAAGNAGYGIRVLGSNNTSASFNTIDNFGSAGILGASDTRLVVQSNYISHTDQAILLDATSGSSIRDNQIGTSTTGIHLRNGSASNVVENNTIAGATTGILAQASNDASILNNTLSGILATGIDVTDSDNALVQGNTLTSAAGASTSGISLTNANNVTVDSNSLSGFGIAAINSSGTNTGLNIQYNTIDHSTDGILLSGTQGANIYDNLIDSTTNAIHLTSGSDNATISYNGITNAYKGMLIEASNAEQIFSNGLTGISGIAVDLLGSIGTRVAGNGFTAASGSNGYGVRLIGADGTFVGYNQFMDFGNIGIWSIGNNNVELFGNVVMNSRQGVVVSGGDHNSVALNEVYDSSVNGISLTGTTNATVDSNYITNGSGNGISLQNADNTTVTNNYVSGKTIGYVANALQGLFFGNNDAVANTQGAAFTNVASSNVQNSRFTNNTQEGFTGTLLNGLTFSGNSFTGNGTGLLANQASNFVSSANTFTNNGIGAVLQNSANGTFTGDVFTGNTLGLTLDGSTGTHLTNLTIATPANGTGIAILNGSGDTLVNHLTIDGGAIGVLLDGSTSAMQFAGNTSRFSNMDFYFVLQNNAMQGQVLDASQQTFDGTRAADFTQAQLAAAESRTLDVQDSIPVGDVFYKFFPSSPSGPGSLLSNTVLNDEAERRRTSLFNRSLFSYAGRTLANNIAEQPLSFEVSKIDLSLLNPIAQPTTTAGIANFFATLAPAAGPGAKGGAVPANLAQQLASLQPSAGGSARPIAAQGTFANSFLDAGYTTSFTANQ